MTYDFCSEVEDSSYLDMSANCNIISMNHLFLLLNFIIITVTLNSGYKNYIYCVGGQNQNILYVAHSSLDNFTCVYGCCVAVDLIKWNLQKINFVKLINWDGNENLCK